MLVMQRVTFCARCRSEKCMRRQVVQLVIVLSLVVSSIAWAQRDEIVVDRIMARIDDQIITRSDMVRAFPIYLQIAARVDPSDMQTREGQARVAQGLLDYMIDQRLLMQRAEKEQMAMSQADVEAYLVNYRESLNMTASQFRQALAGEGVDFDDYTNFMRAHLTRMQMMRSDMLGDVTVLDEEVDQRVSELYPDGMVQPYFETSHILIQLPKNAPQSMVDDAHTRLAELRAQIVSGALDFEDVAAELNTDGTRYRGGLVGTFTLGELDEDYTRASLALDEDEVSQPVRSQFGMHLIRLESLERRPVSDVEGVKNRIRYEIREEKASRQEQLFLRRLRDAAFIEIVSMDFGL